MFRSNLVQLLCKGIRLNHWQLFEITFFTLNNAYLDLVPPVHLCTSGHSLSPCQPVHCGIFNLLPRDPDSFQICWNVFRQSSSGVLFFACHLLESMLLVLWPASEQLDTCELCDNISELFNVCAFLMASGTVKYSEGIVMCLTSCCWFTACCK